MPIMSAGPRSLTATPGTAAPFTMTVAATVATAGCAGLRGSAVPMAAAPPCRTQGRKLRLAFATVSAPLCRVEFVSRRHQPLGAAAVEGGKGVAVLAPGAHARIDRRHRAVAHTDDAPARRGDRGGRRGRSISEARAADAS